MIYPQNPKVNNIIKTNKYINSSIIDIEDIKIILNNINCDSGICEYNSQLAIIEYKQEIITGRNNNNLFPRSNELYLCEMYLNNFMYSIY